MVDALLQSTKYHVELYIADKQCNPFNAEKATKHAVILKPCMRGGNCKFAEANKDKIDFALVGSEKPIIEGVRDQLEKRTGIPVICPKQRYAIEVSKVEQRELFVRSRQRQTRALRFLIQPTTRIMETLKPMCTVISNF